MSQQNSAYRYKAKNEKSYVKACDFSIIKYDTILEMTLEEKKVYDTFKRFFDLIFAFIILIILLPFFITISILIKIFSKGPAIYTQKRIGRKNIPFTLYKFRTMKPYDLGKLWTDENDGRLTKLGKTLRKTHVDELPQLINIIKNEMSFIGPRPERLELANIYKQLPNYDLRHLIKPGLSGYAQLYYKPSTSLEEAREKLKYDIYYVKNRSFIFDFSILLKTLGYWLLGKL